jgi:hypothetical protein
MGTSDSKPHQSTVQNFLAQILTNAKATSTPADTVVAGVETKTCAACGAARPDDTDLRLCAFCGNNFSSNR